MSPQERFKIDLDKNYLTNNFFYNCKKLFLSVELINHNKFFNYLNINFLTNGVFNHTSNKVLTLVGGKTNTVFYFPNTFLDNFSSHELMFEHNSKFFKNKSSILFNFFKNNTCSFQNTVSKHTFIDNWENTRLVKRSFGRNTPLRLVKYPVAGINLQNSNQNLFFFRFDLEETKLKHKVNPEKTYLTFKQKRYSRKKNVPLIKGVVNNEFGKSSFSGKLVLKNNSKLFVNDLDGDIQYRMIKKNKFQFTKGAA